MVSARLGFLPLVVAARLSAQDDAAIKSVLSLNRTGEWARAAAVAEQYLAADSLSTKSTCGVRVGLVYARARLGQNDAAKAALAAFDGHCSNVEIDAGLAAELSQLRRELAGTRVDSSADDGFWPVGDPVALGLNPHALEQHRSLCEETGADACLVVFKRQIVQEWYSRRYRRPVYAMSTTKSVTGLLVGLLIDDQRIRSTDELVCAYVSQWCAGRRGRVTLRHLLTMTSGLPTMRDSSVGFVADKNAFVLRLSPTSDPGTRWEYSNEGAQLLSPILDRAAGEPIQDYARKRLFEPLGMRDTRLHLDVRQHAWTYADMETTPRDLARVGLLMLSKGVWRGRRIVSEAWIDASTRPSQGLNSEYGLLWWLHSDPPGFAGHGHLDTHLHVFPALDLITVRMQAKPFSGVAEGTYEARALPLYEAMGSATRPR
jgi:hypothetical protein